MTAKMFCVKDAIILFSHGSLLCGAGETLKRIAAFMRERGDAPIVEPGYLNYSKPPFAEAVESCVQQGATRVIVAPYFLVAGKFVQVDLKPKIAAAREKFPDVEFRLAGAMTSHSSLTKAIIDCARRAALPAQWRDIWNTAPRFCQSNPDCPLYDTPKCPATNASSRQSAVASEQVTYNLGEAVSDYRLQSSTSLLVMVHGSPRPESNEAMFQVVEQVRQRDMFERIEVGFMECNEPDIPTAIENLLAQGARKIIAVPYFLHAGTHVADDLPGLLEAAQAQNPDVEFLMGDYIGRDLRVADVMRDRVRETLENQ
jgi:sirohydrochlorin cobaltochelatase